MSDTLLDDLRELRDNPVSYAQETHAELHADSVLLCEEVEKLLVAVAALPVELKDPAKGGGDLGAAYNRVWCLLHEDLPAAKAALGV